MANIRTIANQHLERLDLEDNPQDIFDHIVWTIGDNHVNDIRYRLSVQNKIDLINRFVYQEPHPEIYEMEDDTLAAIHPVVNAIFNTPIFKTTKDEPFILYLSTQQKDKKFERLVYDNVHTAFDVLGAINTYYNDRTNGHPEDALGYYIYFGDLVPHEDGYIAQFAP